MLDRVRLLIAALLLCGSVQPQDRFEGAGE